MAVDAHVKVCYVVCRLAGWSGCGTQPPQPAVIWLARGRMEGLMRFWFDTEFYEDGRTIELISIGVVSEDGRTYYAETPEARRMAAATQWLATNVSTNLSPDRRHTYERWQIAAALIDFMGEKPEIWAYYADYDWVVLCQLFGTMMDLPKGWPMYCRDVKQFCDALGNPALPKQRSAEHHALADAKWTREAWLFLNGLLVTEGA